MPRIDEQPIGMIADLAARMRLGRGRGLGLLAASRLFEPVLRETMDMADIRSEDNVVVLGSADLRFIPWVAPRCRQLMFVDDLPDDHLGRMEAEQQRAGHANVRFQWGSAPTIA
jgi:hypothetical protein